MKFFSESSVGRVIDTNFNKSLHALTNSKVRIFMGAVPDLTPQNDLIEIVGDTFHFYN